MCVYGPVDSAQSQSAESREAEGLDLRPARYLEKSRAAPFNERGVYAWFDRPVPFPLSSSLTLFLSILGRFQKNATAQNVGRRTLHAPLEFPCDVRTADLFRNFFAIIVYVMFRR